jgi:hypothetical protein
MCRWVMALGTIQVSSRKLRAHLDQTTIDRQRRCLTCYVLQRKDHGYHNEELPTREWSDISCISYVVFRQSRRAHMSNLFNVQAMANTGNRTMRNQIITKHLCKLNTKDSRTFAKYCSTDRSLCIRHHICLMSLDDNLYLAPITDPGRILDLGMISRIEYTTRMSCHDGG